MRTLEFNTKRQRLSKKPDCDFTGLVAGSSEYLNAKFHFCSEWDRCKIKIASFWVDEKEYAVELNDENSCVIPSEALKGKKFEVSVLGVDPPYRIGTNKTKVKQGVI